VYGVAAIDTRTDAAVADDIVDLDESYRKQRHDTVHGPCDYGFAQRRWLDGNLSSILGSCGLTAYGTPPRVCHAKLSLERSIHSTTCSSCNGY
jgi:hypothetical protein